MENLLERLVVVNQTGLVTAKDSRFNIIYDDLINMEETDFNNVSLKEILYKVEEYIILKTYHKMQSSYEVAKHFRRARYVPIEKQGNI